MIRRACVADLEAIEGIQQASPEAAQWTVQAESTWVALASDRVVGFIVVRKTAPGESEILNLAVDPRYRRRGLGRELARKVLAEYPGRWFLEVRESNATAQRFYENLGFRIAGRRPQYYESPPDAAIVMRYQSC